MATQKKVTSSERGYFIVCTPIRDDEEKRYFTCVGWILMRA